MLLVTGYHNVCSYIKKSTLFLVGQFPLYDSTKQKQYSHNPFKRSLHIQI